MTSPKNMASHRAHCPHCGKELEKLRNPVPTVDVIIESGGGIVLIKRGNPPPGWALPGGFVEYGESLEAAALREAYEETGLRVKLLEQFHTYSRPGRDPRRHTISTVFLAAAEGTPQGGDDAAEAAVFTRADLPTLAFDHQEIIDDYYRYRSSQNSPGCPHPNS